MPDDNEYLVHLRSSSLREALRMVNLKNWQARLVMFFFVVCFAILSVSYLALQGANDRFWQPIYISAMCGAASFFSLCLMVKPCKGWAFKLSGATATCAPATAFLSRAYTLVFVAPWNDDTLAALAISFVWNLIVFVGFWSWWQLQIRPWHVYHQVKCRLRSPNTDHC